MSDGDPKVALCHRTGNGRFVSLSVSVSAEPAHRAHGDGAIGEAVPNQPGKSLRCGLQRPVALFAARPLGRARLTQGALRPMVK